MIRVKLKSDKEFVLEPDYNMTIRCYEKLVNENKFVTFTCLNGNEIITNTDEIEFMEDRH